MSLPPLGVEQGNLWSTQAQEDDLFTWLDGLDHAEVSTLATTREDRPIRMVTFGDLDRPTLLLVGGMHGNEPSGREVLLWFARELGRGAGLSRLTRDRSVAILPNDNPDGREENTRDNSVVVNPNRDHISLIEAEAQAIHAAMASTDPVMIGDFHEYGGQDGAQVWVQPHTRGDTHPLIAQAGRAAADGVIDAAQAAGNAAVEYPLAYRLTLNSVASLLHRVCVLVEVTWRNRTRPQRMALQQAPLAALVDYFTRNSQTLRHACAASRLEAEHRIGADLLHVWEQQVSPTNGEYLPLAGYDLAEAIPQKYIDAHNIRVEDDFIPIKQTARGLLPELLDPDVEEPVAEAARRERPRLPESPLTAAFVQIGGQRREVVTMIHRTGGQNRTVRVSSRDEQVTPMPTAGLHTPFTIDAVATSGLVEAVNQGNAVAPAQLRIDGPCQRPEVQHVQSGTSLIFDVILNSGQWLDVDLDNRTVLLNGQSSRRGRMRGGWFGLDPGVNTILFNAVDSNTDALLTVTWRDAYR